MSLPGCETWTKQRGIASLYGLLYPYTTLTDCLNFCLKMYTCVTVDISSDVCVVHTNINDTANTFNASDFVQYKLNRACFSSTPTSVLTTASMVPSQATFPGKLHSVSVPDIIMLLLQNYAKIIAYLSNYCSRSPSYKSARQQQSQHSPTSQVKNLLLISVHCVE